MTSAEQAPFQKLVKLIEHELELAGQGLVDELDEAVAETGAYMAMLPTPAPDSAQHLVLRAEALRSRVIIEVTRVKESIALSRSSVRRSRRVARQYGPPRSGRYSTSA
jgi:voltage-gated potassium channel Kch